MKESSIFIITFDSPNNSLVLYNLLKDKHLKVYMMQTPCSLSAGCARSIEVKLADISLVIETIKTNNIDIGNIYRKFVNEKTRRYEYEIIKF